MVGMSFFIGCGIYRVNRTGGKRWMFTENSRLPSVPLRGRQSAGYTPNLQRSVVERMSAIFSRRLSE